MFLVLSIANSILTDKVSRKRLEKDFESCTKHSKNYVHLKGKIQNFKIGKFQLSFYSFKLSRNAEV